MDYELDKLRSCSSSFASVRGAAGSRMVPFARRSNFLAFPGPDRLTDGPGRDHELFKVKHAMDADDGQVEQHARPDSGRSRPGNGRCRFAVRGFIGVTAFEIAEQVEESRHPERSHFQIFR